MHLFKFNETNYKKIMKRFGTCFSEIRLLSKFIKNKKYFEKSDVFEVLPKVPIKVFKKLFHALPYVGSVEERILAG